MTAAEARTAGAGTGAAAAVSIVVPHYGDPVHARALVALLSTQIEPPEHEVIVVDDASPTPFEPAEGVVLVRRPVNGGFGAAVNSGAKRARHGLLLVLNSDLEIGPTFLRDLVASAAPWMPAVVSPQLLDEAGAPQWVGRRFPRLGHYVVEWLTPLARFRPLLHGAVGHDTRCRTGASVPVDWVVGAVLLLPTEEFRAVGGFDESFHMNCEEVDLQRRLRAGGVPSVFLGEVSAVHSGGGSSDPARRIVWLLRSRLRYARKWGGRPALVVAALRAASVVNLGANTVRRLARRDVHPLSILRRETGLLAEAAR